MVFVHFLLADEDIIEFRIVPSLHVHRAPYTGSNQAWPPVPTVMIACLPGKYADFLIEYPAVFRLVVACFILVGESIPFGNIYFDGRMEIDFQYVFARFQIWLYVCSPFAKHIVGFQYLLIVQIYVCIRISPLKTSSMFCFSIISGVSRKVVW